MSGFELTSQDVEEPRLCAVVVCYNESRYLAECLDRLSFCDEAVVIDLGSSDDSVAIASRAGARVITHPWVPVVERVREFAVGQATCDWVVFMDPDLMFPRSLQSLVRGAIRENPGVGFIGIRYQNYAWHRPLSHGRWGGCSGFYPAVMHRERVNLSHGVHRGISVKEGFSATQLGDQLEEVIVHYWVDSVGEFLAKHRRYLPEEGKSRYMSGRRTSRTESIRRGYSVWYNSLFVSEGYRDGLIGVVLSFAAGWYEWMAETSLLDYQRRL
ncbi:MAG: glycosyltransferase [Coriobacteriia bacterium]|nr:glycosyltransferase [Coriobacteriia bacterium]